MPVGKRLFDLVIALLLIVPALAICIVVSCVIVFDCRATPWFLQTRVGQDGALFTLVKLRTMQAGTRDGASHEIGVSRVTRSGHWLRRLKIDELPQLWNVLVGDMSCVGPRPCLPTQYELIAARRELGVLAMRPGITGPAQVAGLDMSRPLELAHRDADYLVAWSPMRDLGLLIATVSGHGRGDAAGRGRMS